MKSKVRRKVFNVLMIINIFCFGVFGLNGCSKETNISRESITNDISEIFETKGGNLINGVVGTYYEAGGDYYGAQGDEVVQIKKNEDDSVNVCWFKLKYENGIGGDVAGYSVYGLAENVPNDEFINEKYVKLMGENINDTCCMYFTDNGILELEGKMWIFEKGEKEIDIDEAIKEYKEMHLEMDYQYDSFSKDIDILFWEDATSNMSPVSFNKKWYEEYSYYTSEVGSLELQSSVDGIINVFINGDNYCSFHEDSYAIGDSYSYVVYQCENGIKFEFYPEYESSLTNTWSNIKPLLRFCELDKKLQIKKHTWNMVQISFVLKNQMV